MSTRQFALFLLVFVLAPFYRTTGQVITCEPLFPTAQDSVRIVFNAAEGNRGLKGYTDPIWAHTGLITTQSTSGTDWRYVIANWDVNTNKALLTPLGNDLWEFKIAPDIRRFYNVPASVGILKIAFVFRNADGSRTGRNADGSDLFQIVYDPGLNMILRAPTRSFLVVDPGAGIPVHAITSGSDSVLLDRDGTRLAKAVGNELVYGLIAENEGVHQVTVTAWAGQESVRDSFLYFVRTGDFHRELPEGVADGINYPDDQSAILVLFAPGKEHVFLIGDFNDWTIDPGFLMYKTPGNDRHWIRVENLERGREYVFQYLVDGELRIADPYATKVSDPWNDHFISSSVYPGLIPYPAGK
ncbi:MAG: Por secretion system protein, partial [Bacteroidales bacterium]